LSMNFER